MNVYLLRHGIAEEHESGVRDADRALTHEGEEKLRGVLKMAKRAAVAPVVVLSSPLRRAVETARIAVKELHLSGDILETTALSPGADPRDTWAETYRREGDVLLVGHEPHMSRFAAFLLGSPKLSVNFRKAAMLALRCDEPGSHPVCALEWMLAPKLAR